MFDIQLENLRGGTAERREYREKGNGDEKHRLSAVHVAELGVYDEEALRDALVWHHNDADDDVTNTTYPYMSADTLLRSSLAGESRRGHW